METNLWRVGCIPYIDHSKEFKMIASLNYDVFLRRVGDDEYRIETDAVKPDALAETGTWDEMVARAKTLIHRRGGVCLKKVKRVHVHVNPVRA